MMKTCLLAWLMLAGASVSQAAFVSLERDPFPTDVNSGFGIPNNPTICFPTYCSGNNFSHDFAYDPGYPDFSGPNEIAHTTATFSGTIYDSVPDGQGGFMPGTELGPYSATGAVWWQFDGRTGETTGSWTAHLIQDNLTVSNAYGHSFDLSLDPGFDSIGTLTIQLIQTIGNGSATRSDSVARSDAAAFAILDQAPNYLISLDMSSVHALFSVDGSPQFPGQFGLSEQDVASTPEPASLALLSAPLAALLALRKRAR